MTGEDDIFDPKATEERLRCLQQQLLVGIALGDSLVNVMTALCNGVEALAPGVICSIVAVDDNGRLKFLAGPRLPQVYADAVSGITVGPEVGSCGTAIFLNRPIETVEIASDPLWADYRSLALPYGLRACWSCPISSAEDRVLGAFAFYFREPRRASAWECLIAQECANFCAVAIENSEARTRLNNLAFFDSLTGLGNRATLENRLGLILQHSSETRRPVGIFHIDVVEFRAINDLHGYAVGDRALMQVAERLRSIAGDCDLVVRLGGDDFLVAKTASSGAFDVEALAQEFVGGLQGRYDLEGGECFSIKVRVGVAQFPLNGKEQDELLVRAETALRRAKRSEQGYAIFDAHMQLEQHRRRSLERDVGLGVERGEFAVVFQPQVNAKRGTIGGFETLLRWNHPAHGLIPPTDFIPVAEAKGAILGIGAFVLREACRCAAQWHEKLRLAVNVSPAQIVRSDFAQLVRNVLSETGLEPYRLELEVTESLFIQDDATASTTLRRLKDLGVSVAIDDFGTGYSSLSTLRSFPFDRIKVDRSFVADMVHNSDAAVIVNSVIGLGRAMGLRVVAEGVETKEQATMLRRAGCHELQGYLFGKPLPAENYAHIMRPGALLGRRDRSTAI
ncbi:MAG: EAL domain-containing protein [Proteobacteria bacterium]|nr:EAL domain-containing protein [Pseudomonadota bacterium]